MCFQRAYFGKLFFKICIRKNACIMDFGFFLNKHILMVGLVINMDGSPPLWISVIHGAKKYGV